MRAIWLPGHFTERGRFQLTQEKAHHFLKVLRLSHGEPIKVMLGEGKIIIGTIESIDKKFLVVGNMQKEEVTPFHRISVVLGMPKRNALEDCIRSCVEMGVRELFLYKSDFSNSFLPKKNRMEHIIQAAHEQSNNPFEMQIEVINKLEHINLDPYDHKVYMGPYSGEPKKDSSSTLLFVGPEGGFSQKEISYFESKSILPFHISAPILRTPTALIAGLGAYGS